MTTPPSRTETSNVRAVMQRGGPRSIGKIEKAKDPRNTLKRLIPYLGRFKAGLAAVLVFVLIYTVLGLLGPYLMGVAIDQFIGAKDVYGLARISLLMLAAFTFNNLFQAIANWIMAEISQRALKQMPARPVRASANPIAELFRPQPGRRADEPADQRYRRHQPGGLTKCHLPDRQRAFHGWDPGGHVHPGLAAGVGVFAGGPDHALVHQFRGALHPQRLCELAKTPGRAKWGHGRVD